MRAECKRLGRRCATRPRVIGQWIRVGSSGGPSSSSTTSASMMVGSSWGDGRVRCAGPGPKPGPPRRPPPKVAKNAPPPPGPCPKLICSPPPGLGTQCVPEGPGPPVDHVVLHAVGHGEIQQEAGRLEIARPAVRGADVAHEVQGEGEHPQSHRHPGSLADHPFVRCPDSHREGADGPEDQRAHDQRGQHPGVVSAGDVMVVGVPEQIDQPDDAEDDREAEAQDARHEPDPALPAQDVERR